MTVRETIRQEAPNLTASERKIANAILADYPFGGLQTIVELAGRTVFCLYPHQDLYCVPAEAVSPLPDGVPAGRAVLAANMETAVTIVWDAQPAVGDRIVVIGAGVVGLLVAWLCRRMPGTALTIVDPERGRENVARALDVPFQVDPPRDADADLVIHASGSPRSRRAIDGSRAPSGTELTSSSASARAATHPAAASRRVTRSSRSVGIATV